MHSSAGLVPSLPRGQPAPNSSGFHQRSPSATLRDYGYVSAGNYGNPTSNATTSHSNVRDYNANHHASNAAAIRNIAAVSAAVNTPLSSTGAGVNYRDIFYKNIADPNVVRSHNVGDPWARVGGRSAAMAAVAAADRQRDTYFPSPQSQMSAATLPPSHQRTPSASVATAAPIDAHYGAFSGWGERRNSSPSAAIASQPSSVPSKSYSVRASVEEQQRRIDGELSALREAVRSQTLSAHAAELIRREDERRTAGPPVSRVGSGNSDTINMHESSHATAMMSMRTPQASHVAPAAPALAVDAIRNAKAVAASRSASANPSRAGSSHGAYGSYAARATEDSRENEYARAVQRVAAARALLAAPTAAPPVPKEDMRMREMPRSDVDGPFPRGTGPFAAAASGAYTPRTAAPSHISKNEGFGPRAHSGYSAIPSTSRTSSPSAWGHGGGTANARRNDARRVTLSSGYIHEAPRRVSDDALPATMRDMNDHDGALYRREAGEGLRVPFQFKGVKAAGLGSNSARPFSAADNGRFVTHQTSTPPKGYRVHLPSPAPDGHSIHYTSEQQQHEQMHMHQPSPGIEGDNYTAHLTREAPQSLIPVSSNARPSATPHVLHYPSAASDHPLPSVAAESPYTMHYPSAAPAEEAPYLLLHTTTGAPQAVRPSEDTAKDAQVGRVFGFDESDAPTLGQMLAAARRNKATEDDYHHITHRTAPAPGPSKVDEPPAASSEAKSRAAADPLTPFTMHSPSAAVALPSAKSTIVPTTNVAQSRAFSPPLSAAEAPVAHRGGAPSLGEMLAEAASRLESSSKGVTEPPLRSHSSTMEPFDGPKSTDSPNGGQERREKRQRTTADDDNTASMYVGGVLFQSTPPSPLRSAQPSRTSSAVDLRAVRERAAQQQQQMMMVSGDRQLPALAAMLGHAYGTHGGNEAIHAPSGGGGPIAAEVPSCNVVAPPSACGATARCLSLIAPALDEEEERGENSPSKTSDGEQRASLSVSTCASYPDDSSIPAPLSHTALLQHHTPTDGNLNAVAADDSYTVSHRVAPKNNNDNGPSLVLMSPSQHFTSAPPIHVTAPTLFSEEVRQASPRLSEEARQQLAAIEADEGSVRQGIEAWLMSALEEAHTAVLRQMRRTSAAVSRAASFSYHAGAGQISRTASGVSAVIATHRGAMGPQADHHQQVAPPITVDSASASRSASSSAMLLSPLHQQHYHYHFQQQLAAVERAEEAGRAHIATQQLQERIVVTAAHDAAKSDVRDRAKARALQHLRALVDGQFAAEANDLAAFEERERQAIEREEEATERAMIADDFAASLRAVEDFAAVAGALSAVEAERRHLIQTQSYGEMIEIWRLFSSEIGRIIDFEEGRRAALEAEAEAFSEALESLRGEEAVGRLRIEDTFGDALEALLHTIISDRQRIFRHARLLSGLSSIEKAAEGTIASLWGEEDESYTEIISHHVSAMEALIEALIVAAMAENVRITEANERAEFVAFEEEQRWALFDLAAEVIEGQRVFENSVRNAERAQAEAEALARVVEELAADEETDRRHIASDEDAAFWDLIDGLFAGLFGQTVADEALHRESLWHHWADGMGALWAAHSTGVSAIAASADFSKALDVLLAREEAKRQSLCFAEEDERLEKLTSGAMGVAAALRRDRILRQQVEDEAIVAEEACRRGIESEWRRWWDRSTDAFAKTVAEAGAKEAFVHRASTLGSAEATQRAFVAEEEADDRLHLTVLLKRLSTASRRHSLAMSLLQQCEAVEEANGRNDLSESEAEARRDVEALALSALQAVVFNQLTSSLEREEAVGRVCVAEVESFERAAVSSDAAAERKEIESIADNRQEALENMFAAEVLERRTVSAAEADTLAALTSLFAAEGAAAAAGATMRQRGATLEGAESVQRAFASAAEADERLQLAAVAHRLSTAARRMADIGALIAQTVAEETVQRLALERAAETAFDGLVAAEAAAEASIAHTAQRALVEAEEAAHRSDVHSKLSAAAEVIRAAIEALMNSHAELQSAILSIIGEETANRSALQSEEAASRRSIAASQSADADAVRSAALLRRRAAALEASEQSQRALLQAAADDARLPLSAHRTALATVARKQHAIAVRTRRLEAEEETLGRRAIEVAEERAAAALADAALADEALIALAASLSGVGRSEEHFRRELYTEQFDEASALLDAYEAFREWEGAFYNRRQGASADEATAREALRYDEDSALGILLSQFAEGSEALRSLAALAQRLEALELSESDSRLAIADSEADESYPLGFLATRLAHAAATLRDIADMLFDCIGEEKHYRSVLLDDEDVLFSEIAFEETFLRTEIELHLTFIALYETECGHREDIMDSEEEAFSCLQWDFLSFIKATYEAALLATRGREAFVAAEGTARETLRGEEDVAFMELLSRGFFGGAEAARLAERRRMLISALEEDASTARRLTASEESDSFSALMELFSEECDRIEALTSTTAALLSLEKAAEPRGRAEVVLEEAHAAQRILSAATTIDRSLRRMNTMGRAIGDLAAWEGRERSALEGREASSRGPLATAEARSRHLLTATEAITDVLSDEASRRLSVSNEEDSERQSIVEMLRNDTMRLLLLQEQMLDRHVLFVGEREARRAIADEASKAFTEAIGIFNEGVSRLSASQGAMARLERSEEPEGRRAVEVAEDKALSALIETLQDALAARLRLEALEGMVAHLEEREAVGRRVVESAYYDGLTHLRDRSGDGWRAAAADHLRRSQRIALSDAESEARLSIEREDDAARRSLSDDFFEWLRHAASRAQQCRRDLSALGLEETMARTRLSNEEVHSRGDLWQLEGEGRLIAQRLTAARLDAEERQRLLLQSREAQRLAEPSDGRQKLIRRANTGLAHFGTSANGTPALSAVMAASTDVSYAANDLSVGSLGMDTSSSSHLFVNSNAEATSPSRHLNRLVKSAGAAQFSGLRRRTDGGGINGGGEARPAEVAKSDASPRKGNPPTTTAATSVAVVKQRMDAHTHADGGNADLTNAGLPFERDGHSPVPSPPLNPFAGGAGSSDSPLLSPLKHTIGPNTVVHGMIHGNVSTATHPHSDALTPALLAVTDEATAESERQRNLATTPKSPEFTVFDPPTPASALATTLQMPNHTMNAPQAAPPQRSGSHLFGHHVSGISSGSGSGGGARSGSVLANIPYRYLNTNHNSRTASPSNLTGGDERYTFVGARGNENASFAGSADSSQRVGGRTTTLAPTAAMSRSDAASPSHQQQSTPTPHLPPRATNIPAGSPIASGGPSPLRPHNRPSGSGNSAVASHHARFYNPASPLYGNYVPEEVLSTEGNSLNHTMSGSAISALLAAGAPNAGVFATAPPAALANVSIAAELRVATLAANAPAGSAVGHTLSVSSLAAPPAVHRPRRQSDPSAPAALTEGIGADAEASHDFTSRHADPLADALAPPPPQRQRAVAENGPTTTVPSHQTSTASEVFISSSTTVRQQFFDVVVTSTHHSGATPSRRASGAVRPSPSVASSASMFAGPWAFGVKLIEGHLPNNSNGGDDGTPCLIVQRVMAPADASIAVGDAVLAVDGRPVRTQREMRQVTFESRTGLVAFTILRASDGAPETVLVQGVASGK